jgi:hypothetical protein
LKAVLVFLAASTAASLALAMLCGCAHDMEYREAQYDEPFKVVPRAERPPMGWNSWDVFGTDVTEAEVKAMADYMAEHLKPYGYEYIVVDLGWYAPNASAIGHQYKEPDPEQIIDAYGRLMPSPNRFPSCANGFKPLADYVHSKGLKFGIHVMRGIPNQAVDRDTPIMGSDYSARDVMMYQDRCAFYNGLYSMKADHPGARAYYQSILDLYAEWGVDFIKADDMARTPNPQHQREFMLFRRALESCGRPMVLSMSPGGGVTHLDRSFVNHYADMFRISRDFWDEWPRVENMFELCHTWKDYTGPGRWADCDMIPLGIINVRGEHGDGERKTLLTADEQKTLMTLWGVFRSPLMLGMDLTRLDDDTLKLLRQPDVLACNQRGSGGTENFYDKSLAVWSTKIPGEKRCYTAVFNLEDKAVEYALDLNGIFPAKSFRGITEVWTGTTYLSTDRSLMLKIPAHGVCFLKLEE